MCQEWCPIERIVGLRGERIPLPLRPTENTMKDKQFQETVSKWACKTLGISYDAKLEIKELALLLNQKFPKLQVTVCEGKNGYYIRRYKEYEPTQAQIQSRRAFINKYGTSKLQIFKAEI